MRAQHQGVMKLFAPPMSEIHALKCEMAGEVLCSCGRLRLQVTGWSMLPSVWPGDTLTIERTEPDEVCDGEIVLIARERRLVAHRLIGRDDKDQMLTRGDAMPALDPPVAAEHVLGRVRLIQREGWCLVPRTNLRAWERFVAMVAAKSEFAARVMVGLRSRYVAPRPQTSSDRVVPCQS
jgi:hypothetical protein